MVVQGMGGALEQVPDRGRRVRPLDGGADTGKQQSPELGWGPGSMAATRNASPYLRTVSTNSIGGNPGGVGCDDDDRGLESPELDQTVDVDVAIVR